MEFNIHIVYAALAALLACHIIRLVFQRRINARQLPPRCFTFDPLYNFDWTFSTSLNAKNYIKLQEKYGKTYRLSKVSNPLSGIVTCDPANVHAIMWGQDWGIGWRYTGMKEMLGLGFITTDGDEWMRQRKIMKPAFDRNNIDGFDTLEKVADKLLGRIQNQDGVVDMGPLLFDAVSGIL
jgi:cytochrome P450